MGDTGAEKRWVSMFLRLASLWTGRGYAGRPYPACRYTSSRALVNSSGPILSASSSSSPSSSMRSSSLDSTTPFAAASTSSRIFSSVTVRKPPRSALTRWMNSLRFWGLRSPTGRGRRAKEAGVMDPILDVVLAVGRWREEDSSCCRAGLASWSGRDEVCQRR